MVLARAGLGDSVLLLAISTKSSIGCILVHLPAFPRVENEHKIKLILWLRNQVLKASAITESILKGSENKQKIVQATG